MNILFLLNDTTQDDEFRYVQNLLTHIQDDDMDMKVAFLAGGAPADLAYQLLKDRVVNRLSFKGDKGNLMKSLANHLDNHDVDVVVTGRAMFGQHKLLDAVDKSAKKPRVVFVGHDCSPVVTEHAQILAAIKPRYVAVSKLVAETFMKPFAPNVIYGAAVMPQASNTNIRAMYGVSKNTRLFGYIGNLDLIDTDMLVEAVKRMNGALFVCGTGQKLSVLSQVKGPIKVMPIMPEARADWYHAFDCFLYPVKRAGFPSLPLEAILCGTPVAMAPVSDFYSLFGNNISFHSWTTAKMVDAADRARTIEWQRTAALVEETFSVERLVSGWFSILG